MVRLGRIIGEKLDATVVNMPSTTISRDLQEVACVARNALVTFEENAIRRRRSTC